MHRERALSSLSRRAALTAGLALVFAPGFTAQAQGRRPSPEKLDHLANKAIDESKQTRFSRPQVLGFDEEVVTHQLSVERAGITFFFAVLVPRRPDGLIFFSRRENPRTYYMHRTDTHLRRVASARNFFDQGGELKVWAGPECDADFSAQLAVWATVR